jgi:hypothetical protein
LIRTPDISPAGLEMERRKRWREASERGKIILLNKSRRLKKKKRKS